MSDTKLRAGRGRPGFDLTWPEGAFTAQEIHDALDGKLSRVSVHAKINKALENGELSLVGKVKPRTGRPRIVYKKTTSGVDERCE